MTENRMNMKKILVFCAVTAVLAAAVYLLIAFYRTPYSLMHSFLRNGWRSFLKKEKKKLIFALAVSAAVSAAGTVIPALAGGRKASLLRRIFAVICILGIGVCFLFELIRYRGYRDDPELTAHVRRMIEQNDIIHAAGRIEGGDGNVYDYTDSIEALENCLANGKKVLEIDFKDTTDGVLICAHRWNMLTDPDGNSPEDAISSGEASKCRVAGQFTLMTAEDVAEYMREDEDLYIVTDMKMGFGTGCRMLKKYVRGMQDRVIVQIYNASAYDTARNLGYRNIIFTLFRQQKDDEKLMRQMRSLSGRAPLVGFTIEEERVRTSDLVKTAQECGVPVYSHTVNSGSLASKLRADGVSAFYTDCVGEMDP